MKSRDLPVAECCANNSYWADLGGDDGNSRSSGVEWMGSIKFGEVFANFKGDM